MPQNDPQTDSVSFQLGPDGVPTELSEGDTLGGWQLQSLDVRREGDILQQVDAVFVGTAELNCTVQLSPMNSGVPDERMYQFTVDEADIHKLPALAGSSGGIEFIQLRDEGVENLSVLRDGERHRCSVLITAYHFFSGPMAVYPRAAILGVTLEEAPPSDSAADGEVMRIELMQAIDRLLSDEQMTGFYIADDRTAGLAVPNIDAIKPLVDGLLADGSFGQTRVEYREVANSRARLDAASEEYYQLMRDNSDYIANSIHDGTEDGLIHVMIHQMHPALEEFLRASEYRDCFKVEVTGDSEPLINPVT